MRQRRRSAAGLALVLCILAGCYGDPAPRPVPDVPPAADGLPVPEPSAQRPVPREAAPDGPAPPGPLTVLRASVDLSPAVPGGAGTATAAVGSPDGGAYVVLSPPDLRLPHRLVTVARTDTGYAVTASVPIPRLRPVWDVHVAPGGRVLVSGQFRGDRAGYGFLSVDPAGGEVRTTEVIPFEDGTDLASGSSVLSPDGQTITLFLSSFTDGRHLDLLMSADTSTGRIRGGRDMSEEARVLSESGIGPWSTWLFGRPDGGLSLVFDAYPRGRGISGVPTLLRYDDVLEPVGGAVALAGAGDAARTGAAAGTRDGRVFVRTEVPGGDWLVEVAPGGSSRRRLLELPRAADRDTLVVDPVAGWALVPVGGNVWTVDLSTGRRTPVDVGCPAGVDRLLPGGGDSGAILLGQCGGPGVSPRLWITGPAG